MARGTARSLAAAVRKSSFIAVSRRCCPGRASFVPPAKPSTSLPWRPACGWPEQSGEPRWTALSEVVADAFYRVRFGRQPLDNTAVRGGRTCAGRIGRLPSWAGDRQTNQERAVKIGLVGYQGSGKSTLFHWLTGVAPDPGLAHTGQSAMAPDSRSPRRAALPDLPSEEGHAGGAGTGRYAGPEPLARGQRRPAGDDPRGGLPGVCRGGLRRRRRPRSNAVLRRRPRAGRHGDRRQPHPPR